MKKHNDLMADITRPFLKLGINDPSHLALHFHYLSLY